MDPVVHFEMPYDDPERLARFYENSFGWKMNRMGEEMGHYVLAQTTETNEKQMVKAPGTINGGFFKKEAGMPIQPSVVISVKDIRKTMQKISDAGGKIQGEPMDIPGIGSYVAFTDSEGNRVGILQPVSM